MSGIFFEFAFVRFYIFNVADIFVMCALPADYLSCVFGEKKGQEGSFGPGA
jgi:lipoprotein signal peptidase